MEQTVTGYRKGFGVSVSALDVHGSFDRVMLDDETSKTPQIASLGKCQGVGLGRLGGSRLVYIEGWELTWRAEEGHTIARLDLRTL